MRKAEGAEPQASSVFLPWPQRAMPWHALPCFSYQAVAQLSGHLCCSSALCVTITLISSHRSAAAFPV